VQFFCREGMMRHSVFEPVGWAMLRAPLLPVGDGAALNRTDVRLALEIASPSLVEEMERAAVSRPKPRSERADVRRDRAIRSYVGRMRHRATPFGLFAGVALVDWSQLTDLSLTNGTISPRAQPDRAWLGDVIRLLQEDERLRRRLRWIANPSVIEQNGRLILIEQASGPLPGSGVSINALPPVLTLMASAREPTPYQTLVDIVTGASQAALPSVHHLIDELCRQSFLLCELETALHDPAPLNALLRFLEHEDVAEEASSFAASLRSHASCLMAFESVPTTQNYRRAVLSARCVVPLHHRVSADTPNPVRESSDLQIDGVWDLSGRTVHRAVAAAAAEAAELLLRFTPTPQGPGHLTAWHREFVRRYGTNTAVQVPVVLDSVLGIGAPTQRTHGIGGQAAAQRARSNKWADRQALLRRIALNAMRDGCNAVELDDSLVEGLTTWKPTDCRPPEDVDVIVGIASDSAASVDRGEFLCVVTSAASAPGAGKLAGRFAHLLGSRATAAWNETNSLKDPTAERRAEVMFRPSVDRLLNVVTRSNSTGWVIPVGTAPPASARERVVRPADIFVWSDGDHLRLITGDGCNLTPVATHLLNWSRIPELARFLLEVPRDGRPVLSRFSWGEAASLPLLPRLQRGRIVLSPARWFCDRGEVKCEKDFHQWRDRWAPPRECYLVEGDNRLLIDLDDDGDQELVLDRVIRRRRSVRLDEAIPGPRDAWLPGPDGARITEFAVPLRRRQTEPPTQTASQPTASGCQRRFWTQQDRLALSGTQNAEWHFLKLYVPKDTIDKTLVDEVAPLMLQIEAESLADLWFFIRYEDPAPHLRLRCRPREGAAEPLAQALLSWASGLYRSGHVARFAFDRYEREVARYGGAEGMDIAERIFDADSKLVLALFQLQSRRSTEGEGKSLGLFADRATLAALTTERLVASLGVAGAERSSFYKTMPVDQNSSKVAGQEYRTRHPDLRAVISGNESDSEIDSLIDARSAVTAEAVAHLMRVESPLTQPLDAIRHSFVHMHLNRLLGPNRPFEQLIFGLLERTSRSLAASPLSEVAQGRK
jgi:lantibiotic biosynthesis protein